MPAANIAGARFGRLVAIERDANVGRRTRWRCQCDCGAVVGVLTQSLVSGNTRSCGCLLRDSARNQRTHGASKTPEYDAWSNAKSRCYNPRNPVYRHYGARGITMADEWRGNFAAFFRDMGCRPPGTWLERRDNNGGYSAENCYWATVEAQLRNRRNSRWLTLNGERMVLADWARRLGISPGSLIRALRHADFPDVASRVRDGRIVQRRSVHRYCPPRFPMT